MTTPVEVTQADREALKPCPYVIGDKVRVNVNPERPWSSDWQYAPEQYVTAIRLSLGEYDIELSEEWPPKSGCTDGFAVDDLTMIEPFARHDSMEASRGGEAMPWHTEAALKQIGDLMKAANDLCFAAETACGVAGRDDYLCAAIAHYAVVRDKVKQAASIIRFEWNDPEIGAGAPDHPLRAALSITPTEDSRGDEGSGASAVADRGSREPSPAVSALTGFDPLADAIAGIADDYMTSEQHHPGYVLIPTERFERLRAAAELAGGPACIGAGGDNATYVCQTCGGSGCIPNPSSPVGGQEGVGWTDQRIIDETPWASPSGQGQIMRFMRQIGAIHAPLPRGASDELERVARAIAKAGHIDVSMAVHEAGGIVAAVEHFGEGHSDDPKYNEWRITRCRGVLIYARAAIAAMPATPSSDGLVEGKDRNDV